MFRKWSHENKSQVSRMGFQCGLSDSRLGCCWEIPGWCSFLNQNYLVGILRATKSYRENNASNTPNNHPMMTLMQKHGNFQGSLTPTVPLNRSKRLPLTHKPTNQWKTFFHTDISSVWLTELIYWQQKTNFSTILRPMDFCRKFLEPAESKYFSSPMKTFAAVTIIQKFTPYLGRQKIRWDWQLSRALAGDPLIRLRNF